MTGEPQNAELRDIDLSALDDADTYKLMSLAVQPRPIAWVSTVGADGVDNLAPFSFFNVASRKPPTVMISIGERIGHPGRAKDTLENIRMTEQFAVNIPAVDHAMAVTTSFATVEPDIDEFDLAGVPKRPARAIGVQVVADALAVLECELLQLIPIGTDTLVLGTVVAASVRTDAVSDRMYTDPTAGLWLSRLAGPYYSSVTHGVHQDDDATAGLRARA